MVCNVTAESKVRLPDMVALPEESMAKYLVVEPLLVTEKRLQTHLEAWATRSPVPVETVGVIVWVLPGSFKIQSVQEDPGTDPQAGAPFVTIKTWLFDPTVDSPVPP